MNKRIEDIKRVCSPSYPCVCKADRCLVYKELQPPSENWERELLVQYPKEMGETGTLEEWLVEFIKKSFSIQKSQLIRDEECEKDGYKGRTPCRHTEFWLNEIKDKVREERERVLKILEEEIVATQMTIRGKTSGLTSAYMRIKEQNNEENT